jgi:hypothetical protein
MTINDLWNCFVCSLLVSAVVAIIVGIVRSLSQAKPHQTEDAEDSAGREAEQNLFNRVMQIRRLFAGLPSNHLPKVLARLYDDLREKDEISVDQCEALKQTLWSQFAAELEPEQQRPAPLLPTITPASTTTPTSTITATIPTSLAPTPLAPTPLVPTSLVPTSVVAAAQSPAPDEPTLPVVDARQRTLTTPTPWDMPDPEPRRPRQTLAQWSQSFMEERNIHWGELASGILIVGSALGLVISLRRELQDTIPYFPALLFLLISLAVHYAGVYTLQRWRLRSTSRGLLLISLLLVPLNFLAGVLFNADTDSRRPLTDPWLWVAVVTGTIGTGWVTWSATRLLLRKGHWALFLPVMLVGLGVVVLNRLPAAEADVTRGWTLLPIAALLASVYGRLAWRLSKRNRATAHTSTRVWILAGITTFSIGNVYALYWMNRAPETQLLSSLSPMSSVWVMGLLYLLTHLIRSLRSPALVMQRLIGQGLAGLLWFALFVLLAWTVRCPRDLLLILLLYAGAAFASAGYARSYGFVPVGVSCSLLASVLGRGFVNGSVNWVDTTSGGELLELLINGRSAVMFLIVGGCLTIATSWLQNYFSVSANDARVPNAKPKALTVGQIRKWNSLTAVGLVSVGSLLALIGAYLPDADFWDSMIGTILLFAVALFVIGNAVWGGYRRMGRTVLTVAGSLLLVAACFEASFGNQHLVQRLQVMGWSQPLKAEFAVGLAVVTLGIAALLQNLRSWAAIKSENVEPNNSEPDVRFSAVGLLLAHVGLVLAIVNLNLEHYSLSGVVLGSVVFVGGWSAAFLHPTSRQFWCETITLLGSAFFTGLFFQANDDHDSLLTSGPCAFALAGALAGWCSLVQGSAGRIWLSDWLPARWAMPVEPRNLVLAAVPLLLIVMVALGLSDAVNREIWAVAPQMFAPAWQMHEFVNLTTVVLVGWMVLLFVRATQCRSDKPGSSGVLSSECLILGTLLFMAVWAVQSARWDADVRTASALRWLVALGSLFTALIPWFWPALRNTSLDRMPSNESEPNVLPNHTLSQLVWLDSPARLRVVYTSVIAGVLSVFLITAVAVTGFLTVGPTVKGISPQATWLGQLRTDASYGIPIAILLAAVLLHGISQRQNLLAIAGSYLLRVIVVFQLLLLIVSPHPQLATQWFINIVQMVSAGMTLYGWTWYLNRKRCGTPFTSGNWIQPLQMHTGFNGALLAGLMLLVIGRYWLYPADPLGWIQAAGNLIGLLTLVLYLPLAWIVLWRIDPATWEEFDSYRPRSMFVPVTMVAVATATMLVVNLERGLDLVPGVAFVMLGWCWVVIALGLAAAHGRQPLAPPSFTRAYLRLDLALAWTMVSGLIVAYTWSGLDLLPTNYGHFMGMHAGLLLMGVALGAARQSLVAPYLLIPLGSLWLWRADFVTPQRLLPAIWDHSPSLHLSLALGIGLAWLFGNLVRWYVFKQASHRSALVFGRLMLVLALTWLVLRQVLQFPFALDSTDILLLGMVTLYLLDAWWCPRERWRIGPWAAYHLVLFAAMATAIARWQQLTNTQHAIAWWISSGIVVLLWGVSLRYWPVYSVLYRQWRVPRLAATRVAQLLWLPLLASVVAACLAMLTTVIQFAPIESWERQVACLVPWLAGIGFVWIANAVGRSWQQYASIALFTLTAVLLSWTTVPRDAADTWHWGLLVQTYWVLGVGYLSYGLVVGQGLQHADGWRVTLQRASLALLGGAAVCLMLILAREFLDWVDRQPVISTVAQAALTTAMTVALAIALIVVALVPKQHAIAASMALRQTHVYAAQGLLAIGVIHTALTMPWLFRFGLQQYWPYIAMGLAFVGIGVWHLLQQRKLLVLAEPLATTLLFFPAVAALLSLGLESQTDRSLVMLLAGLVYGALAITHPGFWTRLTAFAFGNLALWFFIERYPLWNFQSHPQLWLIPPAVTALLVSRIEQYRLGATSATTVRYLALAVIYVSSTSEIFIQGIGKNLAPPMILATLALVGMFVGMALKIREYIFLGALFLLVAMFTMVWHAQQQLNHVWPWWAFGITLGVGTLVFFAIFEQRRNQQRSLQRSTAPEEGEN